MAEDQEPKPLYPSRAAAGALLGRQLYSRCPTPVLLLGITPTGVEIAASAAKAMGCNFDVIVGAHIRLEGKDAIGALAEDAEAAIASEFQPRFGLMTSLEEAIDRARRVIKRERLLFRGHRSIRPVVGINAVVIDGHVTSPWKLLAGTRALEDMGAAKVWTAAAACTRVVKERIATSRHELVCPSVLMDPAGHPRPFGDVTDPNEERLKSIVVAREAA